MVVENADQRRNHAVDGAIVRIEAELARQTKTLDDINDRILSAEELSELKVIIANRRAYAAATSALKGFALWIVAIAAAFTVLQGGFVAAVKAAFGVSK